MPKWIRIITAIVSLFMGLTMFIVGCNLEVHAYQDIPYIAYMGFVIAALYILISWIFIAAAYFIYKGKCPL